MRPLLRSGERYSEISCAEREIPARDQRLRGISGPRAKLEELRGGRAWAWAFPTCRR